MLVMFAMIFLLFNMQVEVMATCKFHGYRAECKNVLLLKGVTAHVTVIVNHCHKPIDVTFFVKSQNPQVDWHYAFVTTNPPQREEIEGFGKTVSFHVDLAHNHNPEEIMVQANFHVNDFKDVPLIDSRINIRSFDDCVLGASDSGKVGRTILGIVLTLILLSLSAAIVGWICYRRKRIRAGERVTLVDDMEVDTLSSSQPSSSTSTSTVRLSDIRNGDGDSPNRATAYEPVPS